jgi:hypothetical protein
MKYPSSRAPRTKRTIASTSTASPFAEKPDESAIASETVVARKSAVPTVSYLLGLWISLSRSLTTSKSSGPTFRISGESEDVEKGAIPYLVPSAFFGHSSLLTVPPAPGWSAGCPTTRAPVPPYIADLGREDNHEVKGMHLNGARHSFAVLAVAERHAFAQDDVDYEVTVNQAVARKSQSQLIDYRLEYEPEVRRRLQTFRWGVWGSFLFLFTAVIAALVLAAFWRASPEAKFLLGCASIFVFAWSTLARLGRSATSSGGNTILERIDGWERCSAPLL